MQEQRNSDKNADKVAAAIHYLVARFPAHQLGATKLNKILWFADCEYYARHGCSLTGETHYVRKDQGPWLGRFDSSIAQLLLHRAISERRVRVINFYRREFYPCEEPDVSVFSSEELDTLIKIAAEITPATAGEVAQSSHQLLWECIPPNGKMSVAAGAVGGKPLDEADMEWARSALA